MPNVKLVVSDPETGTAKTVELDEARAKLLYGLRIGSVFDGSIVGLKGCKLMVTGGSDKDGIPMRPDVHGPGRKKLLLSDGVGIKPRRSGERRRVYVRGNTISADIVQVNVKVVEKSSSTV
ncbi:MAG: 30S ribosomal protein S6e [Nitrososphaerota archaeon]|nr:30S ribosomal protein S6e [Candidatus Bathyarchaeota archaeon]MCX8162575.1 30S ribosomal protein S6e [Candidatus Bathyarchaeota archaeon]MDW8061457.1 30S ribosomal protein S6e [Nitrososphaerota archaeon]